MTRRYSGLARLEKWLSLGWLSHLDFAFARFLQAQEPDASHLVLSAGALASQQLGRGEVYLDLEKLYQYSETKLPAQNEDDRQPKPHESLVELSALKTSGLEVWKQGLLNSSLVGIGHGNTPLVLEGNRLYLRRYWQYQQTVDVAVQNRLHPIRDKLPEALQAQITLLFPSQSPDNPDWQKIACVLALRARFSIITGGPGTGKTTTLTKLLALLVMLSNIESDNTRKLNILLAAPTGKAAARVSESITNALKNLDIGDDIKECIPKKAGTLHRLLGSRQNSRSYLHHQHNHLPADIVIIDEASMVDLELMAALMDALPESAQLILLGDKDQLASVEAGSVMGNLCQGAENCAYDNEAVAWIKRYAEEDIGKTSMLGSAINQQTVMLRYSYRFGEGSGIGQLAKAVNSGDVNSAQMILNNPSKYQDIYRLKLDTPSARSLKELVATSAGQITDAKPIIRRGYGHYLELIGRQRPTDRSRYDQWAQQVLEAFDTFRILCAIRLGSWGSDSFNQQVERWLFPEKGRTLWYEGRPVIITRNDYNLGLMNGEIGIALFGSSGKLRVAFPRNDAQDGTKILWISPLRLPEVETAFAMTVHKSQGSEFDHVALILPETKSPVLTRELIYTGITRAKTCFTLVESDADVFNEAILTPK